MRIDMCKLNGLLWGYSDSISENLSLKTHCLNQDVQDLKICRIRWKDEMKLMTRK